MTISSTTNRLVFAGPGNGFAYNKPVFAQSGSDLYVLIEQADGTLLEPTLGGAGTYDFTISGSYDAASFRYPAGVTVTLNNALPSGWTIAIECRPPNTQSSDYTDGGPLPAERLETDLDRLTVMMQTVQGQAGDAVRISPTASGFSNDPIVPIADRVLAFDSAGTAFALLAPNASAYIALPIGIAEGGTGATTILGAQQALDLEPGVDVQAYDADTMKSDTAARLTANMGFTPVSDTSSSGAVTFDFSTGNTAKITLTENITSITLSGAATGDVLEIWFTQAAGLYTVTGWAAAVKWPAATAPTITATSGAVDVIQLRYDGTNYFGSYVQDIR